MFIEGEYVTYKQLEGIIAFVSEKSISILVSRGTHRSQDVRVVVYQSDFKNVFRQNSK